MANIKEIDWEERRYELIGKLLPSVYHFHACAMAEHSEEGVNANVFDNGIAEEAYDVVDALIKLMKDNYNEQL